MKAKIVATNHADPATSSPLMRRLLSGEVQKLTPGQIAAYVESKRRSARSLVAAWSLSGDDAWLREAAERFPDDPQVAVAMLMKDGANPGNAAWIDSLKRNEPANALGLLYASKAAFDAGDSPSALAELAALENVSRINLHSDDWKGAMMDAYRSAGYQGLDAEWSAMAQVPMPLGELRGLSKSLASAMTAAKDGGDDQRAEALGKLGMKAATLVGAREGGGLLVTELVGMSMERQMLSELPIFDLIPGDQKIVVERLGEMDKRTAHIKEMVGRQGVLMPTLTESEFLQYTRRMQAEGELKAMEWLVNQRE